MNKIKIYGQPNSPIIFIVGRYPQLKVVGQNKNAILFSVNPQEHYSEEAINVISINGSQYGHYNSEGALDNGWISRTSWMRNYVYGADMDFYSQNQRLFIIKHIVDSVKDDSRVFVPAMLELIKLLDTDNNVLIGKSYGGLLGAKLSDSPLIKDAILVNPCIQGSPLADTKLLDSYKAKDALGQLKHMILRMSAYGNIEPGKAFTEETARGMADEFHNNGKITVFGGAIDETTKADNFGHVMQKFAAAGIMRMTDKPSDGFVIFEREFYEKFGISLIEPEQPFHSGTQEAEYMEKVFRLL